MAPGGFASIALARSLSAERLENRAVHTRQTVVSTSKTTSIDVLNICGVISKVVKQVRFTSSADEQAVSRFQRRRLTPTEQFDTMLTEELMERRRRETEKVARGVWW